MLLKYTQYTALVLIMIVGVTQLMYSVMFVQEYPVIEPSSCITTINSHHVFLFVARCRWCHRLQTMGLTGAYNLSGVVEITLKRFETKGTIGRPRCWSDRILNCKWNWVALIECEGRVAGQSFLIPYFLIITLSNSVSIRDISIIEFAW